jgi:hypothetical protein
MRLLKCRVRRERAASPHARTIYVSSKGDVLTDVSYYDSLGTTSNKPHNLHFTITHKDRIERKTELERGDAVIVVNRGEIPMNSTTVFGVLLDGSVKLDDGSVQKPEFVETIVASTHMFRNEGSLLVPLVPRPFIDKYIQKGGFTQMVCVELNSDGSLCVRDNNTVVTHKVETDWEAFGKELLTSQLGKEHFNAILKMMEEHNIAHEGLLKAEKKERKRIPLIAAPTRSVMRQ